ncbi:MAG: flagellar biosynthesis protein FliQ [Lachnospiraceae bacterium]|nr:flagellar biosynthesis protein FliQ [Clostridiales bacterium]MDY3109249.1 flagellar biosynthesis protein FliQ [Lachnospiraceae bacterium]
MTVDDISMITQNALFCVIKTAAPVLLVSLAVGLIVSIFQTVTSIQEQTLTFVPKVLSIFLTIMILGHWMLNNMTGFMTELWSDFTMYTG